MELKDLFKTPAVTKPRVKALIYGASGVGKTYLSLTAPGRIAMIDTEAGSSFYADRGLTDYDVLSTKSYKDVRDAIATLAANQGNYQTVVIDPITTIWETLQEAASIARKKKRGTDDEVDLELLDWSKIKRLYKSLMTDLINLPLNVIVTAREKEDMERKGMELVRVGFKPDAEKGTSYAFDTVIRLVKVEGGRVALIQKDRTGATDTKVENPTFATLFPFLSAPVKGKTERHLGSDTAAAEVDATEVILDPAGIELAADLEVVLAAIDVSPEEILKKKGWTDFPSAPAAGVRAAIEWATKKAEVTNG